MEIEEEAVDATEPSDAPENVQGETTPADNETDETGTEARVGDDEPPVVVETSGRSGEDEGQRLSGTVLEVGTSGAESEERGGEIQRTSLSPDTGKSHTNATAEAETGKEELGDAEVSNEAGKLRTGDGTADVVLDESRTLAVEETETAVVSDETEKLVAEETKSSVENETKISPADDETEKQVLIADETELPLENETKRLSGDETEKRASVERKSSVENETKILSGDETEKRASVEMKSSVENETKTQSGDETEKRASVEMKSSETGKVESDEIKSSVEDETNRLSLGETEKRESAETESPVENETKRPSEDYTDKPESDETGNLETLASGGNIGGQDAEKGEEEETRTGSVRQLAEDDGSAEIRQVQIENLAQETWEEPSPQVSHSTTQQQRMRGRDETERHYPKEAGGQYLEGAPAEPMWKPPAPALWRPQTQRPVLHQARIRSHEWLYHRAAPVLRNPFGLAEYPPHHQLCCPPEEKRLPLTVHYAGPDRSIGVRERTRFRNTYIDVPDKSSKQLNQAVTVPMMARKFKRMTWLGRSKKTASKWDPIKLEKEESNRAQNQKARKLGYETLVGNILYHEIPGAKDLNRSWRHFLDKDPMAWGFPYTKGSIDQPTLPLPAPYLVHQLREQMWKYPRNKLIARNTMA